jgi:hypothetical protein
LLTRASEQREDEMGRRDGVDLRRDDAEGLPFIQDSRDKSCCALKVKI